MYAGRIAEMGSVDDVVRRPRHPYTEGLMASIPSMHGDVEELRMIPGAMPRLDAIPEGCAFNPRCTHAGPRCRREVPRIDGPGAACWLALEGATA
jgi:peptide/nickel transport system ATP-binding protein